MCVLTWQHSFINAHMCARSNEHFFYMFRCHRSQTLTAICQRVKAVCLILPLTALLPATGRRNPSFHGLITYLLLPKYTRYTEAHAHAHQHTSSPTATLSSPLHVQHILLFSTSLHNTEELHSGYTFRLDLSIAPLGCWRGDGGTKQKK